MRLILAILCLLGCAACAPSRTTLTRDEITILAWWLEDTAHGLPRRAEELELVDGSERLLALARWARGDEIDGRRTPPRTLALRAGRWPAVRALMEAGLVETIPGALLALKPGLPRDDQAMARPVVEQENRERIQMESTVGSLAGLDQRDGVAFLAELAKARTELDRR